MQLEDMILVSVDDHLVEPPSMSDFFMDHFPAKYRDRVPRVIHRENGTDAWVIEGIEVDSFGLNAVAGRVREEWGLEPGNFGEVRKGTWDVKERVRDMDVNGVLGSMCFSSWPGLGGQYFLQSGDRELAGCMIRAYNDWHIEEWAGAAPGRFIPLALSGFMLGPEWMAGEIRRVAEKGCHAISFHSDTHRFDQPDHHGDEWDPAWQACADTDSVLVFHFGSSPVFMPRSPFDVLIHTMPFNTGVFSSELLWSKAFRKYPTVKIALAEGGIGWMPYWLERADYTYQRHHLWTGQDWGDQLPSQAWKGRVLGCFIDDYTGLRNRDLIGIENIAWECDYPHSDCTWPTAPEDIWKSLQAAECRDDEIHAITWENACRFYSFDPFEHRTREECTVGALRAQAGDVDTTPKRYGKRATFVPQGGLGN
ncbi:MAG TPA: amidohydrolase family protein [Acidimicrobiales bacterium]|nr:amidohydrolase family protein [Acidimicrobiales bacterium]